MRRAVHTLSVLTAGLGLAVVSGCTFIFQPVLVPNRNVEKWTAADPNNYGIQCTTDDDGEKIYAWNHHVSFDPNLAAMPLYGRHPAWQIASAVRGKLNGKSYFTVFDTGASPFIFIEDIQVNRHKMPVFFFRPEDKTHSHGLAFADSLRVGPIEYSNAPCFVPEQHAEWRLFGFVPICRFEWIVLPLDLMAAFGYIEFDQVADEIRMSEDAFAPDDTREWLTFPFEISLSGARRLLLFKLPLEGIDSRLFLDTGAAFELNLSPELMQQLRKARPDLGRQPTRRQDVYSPYAGGLIKSKKLKANDFQFGDIWLDGIEILYAETARDPAPSFDGTIGINLFRDTVMVLDFKQNVMWVKKAEGSLFEEPPL